MNRILVVTDGDSDLLQLLQKTCDVTVISLDSVDVNPNAYDALCVLVGNNIYPTNLSAPLHDCMEKMRRQGKPVFCEFVGPIGGVRLRGTVQMVRQRMAYNAKGLPMDGLKDGDLLDGQSNECIKWLPKTEEQTPILTYQEYVCAHSNAEISEEQHRESFWALWWLDKNTMVSSIRLCNFRRARFAPRASWEALISAILSFLAGEKIQPAFAAPVCQFHETKVESVEDTKQAVEKGLAWITNAGMLKNGGAAGAYEGFTNQINAKTGEHTKNRTIRTDCTCEIGGALLFDALLTGNEQSKKTADLLFKFAFDWLQVKDGEHKGMIRWSEDAWEHCYQDDVARVVLGMLLSQHFGQEVPYLEQINAGLDYMIETTGADGIRIPATEIRYFNPEYSAWLKTAGSGEPCAHFNAYYHAVLLLSYRVCKNPRYLEYAEKGLSTLMKVYPDTRRETSETEEYCRLILPLAILYGVTGKKEHYTWLCKVADDLQKFRHPLGGYAEWDTGYKAFCSRNHKGECALLANNGDPVADLLYSNNWLPLGFAYAYMVTGEQKFYDLWKDSASFILSAQIHSEDKLLDGAWARAFDLERRENNGIPYDIGWGPYCIESGWTVGEILMGLQFMQLAVKKVEEK
ncbi:MAG: hypothetical protein J6K86_01245 [Clostridia bacterium]|nr:hypothetical protein [Clostridia bacterium]